MSRSETTMNSCDHGRVAARSTRRHCAPPRALAAFAGAARGISRIGMALLGLATFTFALAPAVSAQSSAPKTDEEKAFYAIGTAFANQLQQLQPVSARELELVVQGMQDVMGEKVLAVDQNEGASLIGKLAEARQEKARLIEAAGADAFLAAEEKRSGAKKTASGLVITHTKIGAGPSPTATDKVRVHYHGTLRDGKVFDSSVERKQPAEFELNRVIPCWTEGVALMKVGGKARLVCPAAIAYGSRGAPPLIKPGAALAFDVELLEIVKK